jgi:hypothetical protein
MEPYGAVHKGPPTFPARSDLEAIINIARRVQGACGWRDFDTFNHMGGNLSSVQSVLSQYITSTGMIRGEHGVKRVMDELIKKRELVTAFDEVMMTLALYDIKISPLENIRNPSLHTPLVDMMSVQIFEMSVTHGHKWPHKQTIEINKAKLDTAVKSYTKVLNI